MEKKFTLPISPAYVAHWGLWEAIRELIQNAYDEQTRNEACAVEITHDSGDRIVIRTSIGKLTPESLILGNSDKRDDKKLRGQFGEGYKLAMLVLKRLGYGVTVLNNGEIWRPKIEKDETFNSEVLNIYVETPDTDYFINDSGVTFIVKRVTTDQWRELETKILMPPPTVDTILEGEENEGALYVGGLFVRHMKGFKYGYSLLPATLKLDRDRAMVSDFDLSYVTSKLWAVDKYDTKVYTMLKAGSPDVKYVENWTVSTFTSSIYSHYRSEHGDAIPVTTQDEIERATRAGRRWALVPEIIRNLVGRVVSIFIPSSESPVDRLKKFLEQNKWSLNDTARTELEDIIATMEGNPKKVEAA